MANYIFDFDGVMGNTLEVWSQFTSERFRISLERAKKQLVLEAMSNNQDTFFKEIIKSFYYKRLLNYIKKSNSPEYIFHDVIEIIENSGVKKSILTRNDSKICKIILGDKALIFDEIVGRDSVKSKIIGYKYIVNTYNYNPSYTYFITDTVGDIIEMKNIIPEKLIYAVSWGYHNVELLKKYLPESNIFNSPQDIKNFIHKNSS